MWNFIDLTGKKFCMWTVIKRADKDYITPDNRHYPQWLCRCECGKKQNVLGSHLRGRHSGRCLKCKYKQMQLMGRMPSRMFYRIKSSEKTRGHKSDPKVTREYLSGLIEAQKHKCALTGIPIKFADTTQGDMHGETTASPDRIDSSKGYLVGNIQWVHKDINKMKGVLSQDRFLELCRAVSKRHKKRKR